MVLKKRNILIIYNLKGIKQGLSIFSKGTISNINFI